MVSLWFGVSSNPSIRVFAAVLGALTAGAAYAMGRELARSFGTSASQIAGLVAGYIEELPLPQLFGTVAAIVIGTALLFVLGSPFIKKMCHGVN